MRPHEIFSFGFLLAVVAVFLFTFFVQFLHLMNFRIDILSENDDKEIERFSDRKRKAHAKREALASYLKLTSSNFPAELLQGRLEYVDVNMVTG
jgi:hypothetical protein